MQPWLIYTESFVLPAYFTMIVLAACSAPAVLTRESRRDHAAPKEVLDLAIVAVPAVLIGARLGHVLVEPTGAYWRDPWLLVGWQSGTAFWGAMIAGIVTLWSYSRQRGLDPWALADRSAPATALAIMIGRLGCLAGGCCHGKPADWPFGWAVPWSITMHNRSAVDLDLLAVPLHPWPLYDAALNLGLFVWVSSIRARQRYVGEAALSFVAAWGLGRAVLEYARGDAGRRWLVADSLTVGQGVTIATALVALIWARTRAKNACTPS